MMRLSGLIDLPVRDAEGRLQGRLHEIRTTDGLVTAIVYGPAGLFERMTGRTQPTAIPWSRIARIEAKGITLR